MASASPGSRQSKRSPVPGEARGARREAREARRTSQPEMQCISGTKLSVYIMPTTDLASKSKQGFAGSKKKGTKLKCSAMVTYHLPSQR